MDENPYHIKNSRYIGNPTFRKFVGGKSTYYIPVDILNAADNVLVDTRDPHSAGFGGSTFDIKTCDGDIDVVKGPWHGSAKPEHNVGELHFTQVILIANAEHIPYDTWSEVLPQYAKDSVEWITRMRGDVLYYEKEPVLGTFYRGDRIAQQLADLRQEEIYVYVHTAGGSHARTCKPGDKLHPRATRSTKPRNNADLSSEQSMIVDL